MQRRSSSSSSSVEVREDAAEELIVREGGDSVEGVDGAVLGVLDGELAATAYAV